MAIKVAEANPLTSQRALLKIEHVQVQESPYTDPRERPQVALVCDLMVLKGAGDRNNEAFREYLNVTRLDEDGNDVEIRPNTKAGQVVFAALRGEITADTAEGLAKELTGKLFISAIGTSKNGEYSRLVHDTIGPAPEKQKPEPEPEPEKDDDPDDDFDDLPF